MKQQLIQNQEEQSLFAKALGDYPLIRVLDFLIVFQLYDYPPTEIAKNSKVSFVTFQTFWPKIIEQGYVTQTRKIGNATLYKLNKQNPIIKKLIELGNVIAKSNIKIYTPHSEL